MERDGRIGLRIPHLVVDAVEDAAELVLVRVQRMSEASPHSVRRSSQAWCGETVVMKFA